MNIENTKHRIELLNAKHKRQHSIVEVLEAEKAPEKAIQKAKIEKLAIKDEIVALESALSERLNNVN